MLSNRNKNATRILKGKADGMRNAPSSAKAPAGRDYRMRNIKSQHIKVEAKVEVKVNTQVKDEVEVKVKKSVRKSNNKE